MLHPHIMTPSTTLLLLLTFSRTSLPYSSQCLPTFLIPAPTMHRLICGPQNYAWGKYGLESEVARLLAASGGAVDESLPYAELWMGTHHKVESLVLPLWNEEAEMPLSEFFKAHPAAAGTVASAGADFDGGLPYLFKVRCGVWIYGQ